MSVEEIDESEFSEPVKGDVNADGKLNAADAVMLQKWLTGVPDATLSNWKAADLYEDGVLNAFDLCMMKRELMNQNQYDDTPVLFINVNRIIMIRKTAGMAKITTNNHRQRKPVFSSIVQLRVSLR